MGIIFRDVFGLFYTILEICFLALHDNTITLLNRYWRPQILLLISRPACSTPLMDFVNDLKKSGLYVIGHVKRGSMDESTHDPLQQVFSVYSLLVAPQDVSASICFGFV